MSFAPSAFFVLVFIPEPEVEFPSFSVFCSSIVSICVYSLFCFLRSGVSLSWLKFHRFLRLAERFEFLLFDISGRR